MKAMSKMSNLDSLRNAGPNHRFLPQILSKILLLKKAFKFKRFLDCEASN